MLPQARPKARTWIVKPTILLNLIRYFNDQHRSFALLYKQWVELKAAMIFTKGENSSINYGSRSL